MYFSVAVLPSKMTDVCIRCEAVLGLERQLGKSLSELVGQVLPPLWASGGNHFLGTISVLQPLHSQGRFVSNWMDCRADAHLALWPFVLTASRSSTGHPRGGKIPGGHTREGQDCFGPRRLLQGSQWGKHSGATSWVLSTSNSWLLLTEVN